MNIRKLFLLTLLGLSTAAVRPNVDTIDNVIAATGTLGGNDIQFIAAVKESATTIHSPYYSHYFLDKYLPETIVPGALAGAFTGTAISYLAGTLFDAVINQKVIDFIAKQCEHYYGNNHNIPVAAIVNIARVAAQIGSKQYWEKPLRNKVMNWMIDDLKAKGVEFNEELMKTVARVSAWLGTSSQIKKGYWTTYFIF
jgi:hypothetical protein